MNLHEYQSKQLFAEYGIPVPKGVPASTPDEAVQATETLGGDLWVVKAQVHAGGRGKAGGVKLARSADEVRQYATDMLGTQLVTHQSGPEGLPVNIEMISRFRSNADVKKAIGQLEAGSLDIVIGTHRLIAKDIGFKKLD